jgi:Skp family chaperone for outer membrane proteins
MKLLLIIAMFITTLSCATTLKKEGCDYISGEIIMKTQLVAKSRERLRTEFESRDIQLLEEQHELSELNLQKVKSEISGGSADPYLIARIEQLSTVHTNNIKKFEADLNRRRSEEFKIIIMKAREEIRNYAIINDIDLIIGDEGIIYSKSSIPLSDGSCENRNDISNSFFQWLENE